MASQIAVSMLSADFLHLEQSVRLVNGNADLFHLDIMDGVFVPNISFGFPVVEAIASAARKPLDTHLMIVEPEKYVERFAKAGSDMLSFHLNATGNPEKVIDMMPAVDSIMPMLKSFKGRLNCIMSATAAIDTLMSIETPTINGVLRITGENLELSESTAFSEIARKLKFKDRRGGHIDHMSVEGLISDNRLEIFPFVLKVDRYTLAMSGIQNLDSSFRYHVSVIQSPIPFRLGIDLSGTFDDFKFRIGKAKYKSADVPVFSGVIDKTRINLRESIRNIFQEGVDKAVSENEQQRIIEDYKQRINYRQAVDQQLDSLSAEEKAQIE